MLLVSAWSSEEWLAWGVKKYPDDDTVQKHANNLFDMNCLNTSRAKRTLGLKGFRHLLRGE